MKLISLGSDPKVVQHNIPFGIGKIVGIKLLSLSFLDFGCVLSVLVGLVVARRTALGDVLKVGNHLLSGLGTGGGVGRFVI